MKIVISYATTDLNTFQIPRLATKLEEQKEIEQVYYWDRDCNFQDSIVKYMEKAIVDSSVMIAICSEAANASGPVQQEIDMAVYLNKRIVPVFLNLNDVRISMRPKRGIRYNPEQRA